MTRHLDWPQRLHAAIEAASGRPFSWGRQDCSLWAADVVLALTGFDPAHEYRGRYRNELGARRVLLRRGPLALLATRALGDPIRATEAQRGDVVLACRAEGQTLGICIDTRCAFVGPGGLTYLPVAECIQAWRV